MAFFPLAQLSDLYDGYQKAFRVDGYSLLLCQLEGQTFLIENRCPHMDAPMTDAAQAPGCLLRCRAHGIEFSLKNGRALGPLSDTISPLRFFPLEYEGTKVGVDSEAF